MRHHPFRGRGTGSMPGIDVLHLEDDDEYAELVRLWVTARGLALDRVRSREELLGYLAVCAPPPRCLLLDMSLQDSQGLGLCDELKTSPALQQLPIVLLSGSDFKPCECQEHGALHFLRKGVDGGAELLAALKAVISQHNRSRGVVDAGDLRLEPEYKAVLLAGELAANLDQGPFDALALLVKSSPASVSDADLYLAFLERHPYKHHEQEADLTVKSVVKSYISRLRGKLGPVAGARIVRSREEGYVYLPPK